MHDQMKQSEQIKWVFAESARMIGRPFVPVIEFYAEVGRVISQPIFDLVDLISSSRLQKSETRNLLENLSDDSLLDRMWIGEPAKPGTMRSAAQGFAAFGHEMRRKHIPVIANDEPVSIPVRFKTRRLSIDGILAR